MERKGEGQYGGDMKEVRVTDLENSNSDLEVRNNSERQ